MELHHPPAISRKFGAGNLAGVLSCAGRKPSTCSNTDDPAKFGLDAAGREVTIVSGAGVDPSAFPVAPEPPVPPIRFAVVARMVRTKGITEAVAAIALARVRGAPVEFTLFGPPDPSNRRAFTEAELRTWSAQPGVHWHGSTEDIAQVWRAQHVAMLLSCRFRRVASR
jgi:glycosyltransferase involved in cell wall biosynthesis